MYISKLYCIGRRLSDDHVRTSGMLWLKIFDRLKDDQGREVKCHRLGIWTGSFNTLRLSENGSSVLELILCGPAMSHHAYARMVTNIVRRF